MNGHKDTETCIFLDNSVQLDYVIEDFEYTKWLDPDPEVTAHDRRNYQDCCFRHLINGSQNF